MRIVKKAIGIMTLAAAMMGFGAQAAGANLSTAQESAAMEVVKLEHWPIGSRPVAVFRDTDEVLHVYYRIAGSPRGTRWSVRALINSGANALVTTDGASWFRSHGKWIMARHGFIYMVTHPHADRWVHGWTRGRWNRRFNWPSLLSARTIYERAMALHTPLTWGDRGAVRIVFVRPAFHLHRILAPMIRAADNGEYRLRVYLFAPPVLFANVANTILASSDPKKTLFTEMQMAFPESWKKDRLTSREITDAWNGKTKAITQPMMGASWINTCLIERFDRYEYKFGNTYYVFNGKS